MEFIDEYESNSRPRFILQSTPSLTDSSNKIQQNPHSSSHDKLFLAATTLSSLSLLLFTLFYLQSEPLKSLLIWLSLSFLIGPFAPSHATGGIVRVGHGPIVEGQDEVEMEEAIQEPEKRGLRKRSSKQVGKSEDVGGDSGFRDENRSGFSRDVKKIESLGLESENGGGVVKKVEENRGEGKEGVWSEEDVVLLKKLMVKNPVGKLRRWEVIAEAFGGKYRAESVVKKAKELGERKMSDSGNGYVDDSYATFLKNRKPLDSRIQQEDEVAEGRESGVGGGGGGGGGGRGWSSGEDMALLNALKAFTKDTQMRWEKIASAVPGKSKAACMKRVSELKNEFRSSKAAVAES